MKMTIPTSNNLSSYISTTFVRRSIDIQDESMNKGLYLCYKHDSVRLIRSMSTCRHDVHIDIQRESANLQWETSRGERTRILFDNLTGG